MKDPTSLICCVLASLAVLVATGSTQESKTPAMRSSVDGPTIFRHYCASCHGTDGKGNGPAAAALKVKVPDLTRITKRAGGEFPKARIRNILEGTESPVPHGSQQMPVWGPVFHEIDADQDLGHVRVDNVASYIESLQQK